MRLRYVQRGQYVSVCAGVQGETSMQRNLELQAENLMAQMELQEQLSRCLPWSAEGKIRTSARLFRVLRVSAAVSAWMVALLRAAH